MEMDPSSLIEGETYAGPNAAPCKLADFWQFQMNGDAVISESRLGKRRAQFVPNFGQLEEVSAVNHERSANASARKGQNGTMKRQTAEDGTVNDSKKRHKTGASKEMKSESKTGGDLQNSQAPKQDHVHGRARRGQATDSHSLAERARREKISEKMKILQDLVPGCNKVIGKALVLDEIINYIESLQHQVEMLSMKLEAVNARMSPRIHVFPPKDYGEHTYQTNSAAFGSHGTRECGIGSWSEWLHMQVGGAFERTS